MRIFGPNSQGIQNADPEVSVYANFTFVPMKPGNISIIAQGGGMGEMLKLHLHNVGLGPPHVLLLRQRVRPDDARDPRRTTARTRAPG